MLASMNIDEQAKPAVMAYKRGVEAFPPPRRMSVLLSVARRCPALLILLWQIGVCLSTSLSLVIVLLPFVVFEILRIKEWLDACQRAAVETGVVPGPFKEGDTSFLDSLDSMTILLSGDNYSVNRPPTLLGVWKNVLSSVSALEAGLTAARCVQTTAVTVDFAQNIMSLIRFGGEVAERGWIFGLATIAKEVLVLHATQGVASRSPGTPYASAAVNAVRNSQTIHRNVSVLMREENAAQLLGPILSVAGVLVGHGWLWGREEERPTPVSTVEIEQLPDDDTVAIDEFARSSNGSVRDGEREKASAETSRDVLGSQKDGEKTDGIESMESPPAAGLNDENAKVQYTNEVEKKVHESTTATNEKNVQAANDNGRDPLLPTTGTASDVSSPRGDSLAAQGNIDHKSSVCDPRSTDEGDASTGNLASATADSVPEGDLDPNEGKSAEVVDDLGLSATTNAETIPSDEGATEEVEHRPRVSSVEEAPSSISKDKEDTPAEPLHDLSRIMDLIAECDTLGILDEVGPCAEGDPS